MSRIEHCLLCCRTRYKLIHEGSPWPQTVLDRRAAKGPLIVSAQILFKSNLLTRSRP